MVDNEPFILFVVIKRSLQLNNHDTICCVADAVQCILMKYFTLQLLSAKMQNKSISTAAYVQNTTKWLASHSEKKMFLADDDDWEKVKSETTVGRDLFSINETIVPDKKVEAALVFWPSKYSDLPQSVRTLQLLD